MGISIAIGLTMVLGCTTLAPAHPSQPTTIDASISGSPSPDAAPPTPDATPAPGDTPADTGTAALQTLSAAYRTAAEFIIEAQHGKPEEALSVLDAYVNQNAAMIAAAWEELGKSDKLWKMVELDKSFVDKVVAPFVTKYAKNKGLTNDLLRIIDGLNGHIVVGHFQRGKALAGAVARHAATAISMVDDILPKTKDRSVALDELRKRMPKLGKYLTRIAPVVRKHKQEFRKLRLTKHERMAIGDVLWDQGWTRYMTGSISLGNTFMGYMQDPPFWPMLQLDRIFGMSM